IDRVPELLQCILLPPVYLGNHPHSCQSSLFASTHYAYHSAGVPRANINGIFLLVPLFSRRKAKTYTRGTTRLSKSRKRGRIATKIRRLLSALSSSESDQFRAAACDRAAGREMHWYGKRDR